MKIAVSFLSAIISVILAYNPALAYRPFSTEDAGVAGQGVFQAEIGWDYTKWKNDDEENMILLVPKYGISENLDLSVEIPYLMLEPDTGDSEDGVGDISLVAKYLLVPEKDSPAITIKGVVKWDNGDEDKGLGTGDMDYSVAGVASETVGSLTGHLQYGYTWVGDGENDNLRDVTFWGVALDYAMGSYLSLAGEVSSSENRDRTAEDDPMTALVGLIYKYSDNLAVDAAYKWGFNDDSPDWGATAGVTMSF